MSMHKKPASHELVEALKKHGLPHDKPSQLADAFRSGWYAHQDQNKLDKTSGMAPWKG